MKKHIIAIMTVSLAAFLIACSAPKQEAETAGEIPAMKEVVTEDTEAPAEILAQEPEETEQKIELFGIIKYSRTELGMRMEYDVSDHQINENGQIMQFSLHRTKREQVSEGGTLLEEVDTEDSTIALVYDGNGMIVSARTDIPGYGYQMHELSYKDGLIDTDEYSTDWSTVEKPYKHQFTYEVKDSTVTSNEGKRIEGTKSVYPHEYAYNDNGNVSIITINPGTDYQAVWEIEYDNNGNVTKIISSNNVYGTFLVREFEYVSLGTIRETDAGKTGFQKWQEFSIIEESLMNCY